jgi:hypothetical protein
MNSHDDERLLIELGLLGVPDHGLDYRMRREAALADAGRTLRGGGQTVAGSAGLWRRPGWRRPGLRRTLIVAATACFFLAAASLATVQLLSGSGSKPQGSAPITMPTQSSSFMPGFLAGAAPSMEGDELAGIVRGLDGTPWAWGIRRSQVSGRRQSSPLVERWDGQRWQIVPVPAGEIAGLAAPAGDDIWLAVEARRKARLLHWDGTAWTAVPSIPFVFTSEPSNALLALSSNDIWAIGSTAITQGQLQPHLRTQHWGGSRWASVPGPVLGSDIAWTSVPGPALEHDIGEVSLRLIRGVSPDDLWALGEGDLLLHWDGRHWTRQPWPTRQLASNPKDRFAITDMAIASDGELWCAGQRWFGPDNTSDLWVSVVLRLQAGRWQIMASSATPSLPADWTQFMAKSISLTSPQDVWVAGGEVIKGATRAILWHWNGDAWSAVDLRQAQEPDSVSNTNVLALAADDVWAFTTLTSSVSDRLLRREPLFFHFNGTTWSAVPAAPLAVTQP